MAIMRWHKNPWVLMILQLLLWKETIIELTVGSWVKNKTDEMKISDLSEKNRQLWKWKTYLL